MGKRPTPLTTETERLTALLNTLSDTELSSVQDFIQEIQVNRRVPQPELFDDDLVSTLERATENVRARQVYAWEQIRRQAVRRAPFAL